MVEAGGITGGGYWGGIGDPSTVGNLQAGGYGNGSGFLPFTPKFNSNLDQWGDLKKKYRIDPYQTRNGKVLEMQDPEKTGMKQFQDYATGTGNSPWAKLMLDENTARTGSAYDSAAKSANAGVGKAYSELGARGGLRQGAAERIAAGGERDLLNSRQDVAKQDTVNRLGIMGEDAKGRINALSQLPGMHNAQTSLWAQVAANDSAGKVDVQKYNNSNALGGLNAQNEFNKFVYGQQMAGNAANQTAQATLQSGKK